MPPRVSEVLETCLYVDDLDAAEKFYSEALGLTLHSKLPGRHLFFRCGNRMLLVFHPKACSQRGETPPHGAHGPGHVAFVMADEEIDAWKERLAACGVPIELEHNWGGAGRSLYFRDPAGNSVELATPSIWGW
jgi:catechol 2,3-dioxygenase-like lactoylglutathione lyase family enzyme